MKGGMGGWREDDLESFEVELERHELSPEGIAETRGVRIEEVAAINPAPSPSSTRRDTKSGIGIKAETGVRNRGYRARDLNLRQGC